ncbi:hypothetical protein GG344DRAFT_70239 [Lentinula edodes]|nr:hypothetical protein GG344DRAFT_70239 [Lentinula edodes]
MSVSIDVFPSQAQSDLKVMLGTEASGSIFFVLNDPIAVNNKPTMAAQLGHFSYKWTRWNKCRLQEALKTNPDPQVIHLHENSFQSFLVTNVRNIAPSDCAMLFATKMANELCVMFRDEQEEAQRFCSILSEFLGKDVVSNATIGNFKTDGGGVVDGRNARAVTAWVRARLPLLISHPGPNIQILGDIEVLTPSVPMYYHVSNQDLFLDLACTLTALHVLFGDLGKLYDNPPSLNPLLPVQHVYPYPHGFKRHDEVVETKEDILYIKFTQRYGAEAHRKAHEFGIAPELIAYDDTLPGGWKMVVMKPIPKGYMEIDSIKRGSEEQGKVRALVIAQMQRYLNEGYDHGDLRAANIFVDGERHNIMVIDYDWAGRTKEVMYPPDVRSSMEIWRPRGDSSLRAIETEHDWQMLEHLYY